MTLGQTFISIVIFGSLFASLINSQDVFLYNRENQPDSPITCGLQNDCDITCMDVGCKEKEFYFYNNNIKFTCYGWEACRKVKIYVINATSFNLISSGGNYVFHEAVLYANGTEQNIILACKGRFYSCQSSQVILSGKDQNVELFCQGSNSCNKLLVDAVQTKSLIVHCEHSKACSNKIIYAPSNPDSTVIINVHTNSQEQMHIYSLYGTAQFICNDSCTNLNNFFMLYGIDMSNFCEASDEKCMNESYIYGQNMRQAKIEAQYVQNVNNFSVSNASDIDHLIVFLAKDAITASEILQSPVDVSSIHVIYPSRGNKGVLNFSLAENASLSNTAPNSEISILGPRNSFTKTSYDLKNTGQYEYYLNNTKRVQFLCGEVLIPGKCLVDSKLFLGYIDYAFIDCGSADCNNADIYIDNNPYTEKSTRLDIECFNDSATSCNNLLIHFKSANFICTYDSSVSYTDCNHTNAPTKFPTSIPSFTPTRFPTALNEIDALCSVDEGIIDTTYQLSVGTPDCVDNISEFIANLLHVIDKTYHRNNLIVYSNITKTQWQIFAHINHIPFCGNTTFHIFTCFDDNVQTNGLLNFSKSTGFERDINDEINRNNTIVYIKNVTIVRPSVTLAPENQIEESFVTKYMIWIICGAALLFCIMILCFVLVHYKKKQKFLLKERLKQAMNVNNAMVLIIAIGVYDENPSHPADELSNVELRDLVYPYESNETCPRLHWRQQDIITFLKGKAHEFSENSAYDGLVVCFSSHGILGHICTSDYKLISKLAIQRIFTVNYKRSRNFPRLFIFDGCQGDDERGAYNFEHQESFLSEHGKLGQQISKVQPHDYGNRNEPQLFYPKSFQPKDIIQKHDNVWASDTKPPDHKGAEIHAASPGFQAKLRLDIGSYLIYSICQRMLTNLERSENKFKFIGEIYDEVQSELQIKGKEHIRATFNDRTRFIRFMKRQQKQSLIHSDVEMT
eukprot:98404_1